MSLVDERNEWFRLYSETSARPFYLIQYETNRNSELWRAAREHEKLCEYAKALEGKLRAIHDIL
jgi:hypothetical protein